MKKELFDELLESVKQAKAIERGELKRGRVHYFVSGITEEGFCSKVSPRKTAGRSR